MRKVTCARGRTHPSYDVALACGNPTRSITLGFRNLMFKDLHLKISGELRIEASFPAQMSKWKRYVTLTEDDLVQRASMLDVWVRDLFSLRPRWPPSVARWMNQFFESALNRSVAMLGPAPAVHATPPSMPPPPEGSRAGAASEQPPPAAALGGPAATHNNRKKKKSAAFLSHFKLQAGTEARLVHGELKAILGGACDIFLDSDDLQDLRQLLQHVIDTEVLLLLQSRDVLTRPWVILEIFTALTNGVPIVALNVQNSYPYDYAKALEFMMHFDQEIEIANPGAATLLVEHGVDPVDVAWRLSDSLPNIISTDFNPNASSKIIKASLEDLVDTMKGASPMAATMGKEEWLAMRAKRKSPGAGVPERRPHGSGIRRGSGGRRGGAAEDQPQQPRQGAPQQQGATSGKRLADVPTTVPELPSSYLVREEDIGELKAVLLEKPTSNGRGRGSTSTSTSTSTSNSTALTSKRRQNKVGAHGMGGVGKTTMAAALVQTEEIRGAFDKIVWVSVGQQPDVRELQESIHEQLTENSIPESATTPSLVMTALRNAAKAANVLLVLDDIWDGKAEKPLNCIDPDSDGSRLLVTTRIRGLLRNAREVSVGVLSEKEALELLLSSAGLLGEEEGGAILEGDGDERRIALEILDLCGHLPLTIAIAGGMVRDNPDGITEELVELMKEDHLREQDDEEGDSTLEERIIEASLKMVKGKNRDLTVKVFLSFACFPEDVPVPAGLLNVLAPMLASIKDSKKAKISIGHCLSQLLNFNLLKGALAGSSGVFMHDIVRDYVISRHTPEELRALQRAVADTILAARPRPGGFPAARYAAAATFEGYAARQRT
jgi:hypothetical protein